MKNEQIEYMLATIHEISSGSMLEIWVFVRDSGPGRSTPLEAELWGHRSGALAPKAAKTRPTDAPRSKYRDAATPERAQARRVKPQGIIATTTTHDLTSKLSPKPDTMAAPPPNPPTIRSLKLSFIAAQTTILSQCPAPSRVWRSRSSDLPPRVVGDALAQLELAVRRHCRRVYHPQASRNVAEQIAALYARDAERRVGGVEDGEGGLGMEVDLSECSFAGDCVVWVKIGGGLLTGGME